MLKPAREIAEDLIHRKDKASYIFIHGVGIVTNVNYERMDENEYWTFDMRLDNQILIKSYYYTKVKQAQYLKEGDNIEFFGTVGLIWNRRRKEAGSINIAQLKLSNKTKCFTEVLMWDAAIRYLGFGYGKQVFTDKHSCMESCLISITEVDEEMELPDNEWTYGYLVKSGSGILLQLNNF